MFSMMMNGHTHIHNKQIGLIIQGEDILWHHMSISDVICRPDIMLWPHMTSWCHTIGQETMWSHSNQNKWEQSRFSTWWPWTLTYDLDLWTHLRYCHGTCPHKLQAHISIHSAVRVVTNTHPHGHTEGTDSITLTADAGGYKRNITKYSIKSYNMG